MRRTIALALLIAVAGCAMQRSATSPPRSGAGLADADTLRVTALVPGVWHTYAWFADGPWAAHVVEIDQALCRPQLEARMPGSNLSARERTSTVTGAALAGINADFFMLPGGTPVGAQVSGGVPLIGPTDRQVFGWSGADWWIGIARLDGSIAHRADSVQLVQINRPATAFSAYRGTTAGATLFTALNGDSVAADSTAWRVRLRVIDGNESRGRGVVTSTESANTSVRMDAASAVVLTHGDARTWARRRSAGDTMTWHARLPMTVGARTLPAQEAVGGFPELLRGGQDVLATQTIAASFGPQRHPRTAIGWSADRARLFLVVVDGRQTPYSDGMSLQELAWLFRRIGASDALNLDGGGSSALVIRQHVTNRPSDAQGERAVGNALVLTRCAG